MVWGVHVVPANVLEDWYCPASQEEHVVSATAEHADAAFCPAAHIVQLLQLSSFELSVYMPTSQGWHVRSTVVEPEAEMYFPASHVVFMLQLVSPSAVLN